jgi:hypothetical protein
VGRSIEGDDRLEKKSLTKVKHLSSEVLLLPNPNPYPPPGEVSKGRRGLNMEQGVWRTERGKPSAAMESQK